MSPDSTLPNVPQMQAESGFEEADSAPPLRISGFLCLLLGMLSVLACFGQPLLVVPLAAFLLGFIALRRTGEQRPVGTTPAMIGMVLAAGFGACGLFVPWFKTMTLGSQAEKFGRDYLEVVSRGDDYYAMELKKDYANRYPTTMDLSQHYALDEKAREGLDDFQSEAVVRTIRERGPGAEWALDQPIRVTYSHGSEHAELVWRDPSGSTTAKIHMFLEYLIDSNGNGQWHVEGCLVKSRRFVAPAVL